MKRIRLVPMVLLVLFATAQSSCAWRLFKQKPKSAAAPEAAADATHAETASLNVRQAARVKNLDAFCLNQDGNLLVCAAAEGAILVLSPEGKLLDTWKPGLNPEAIVVHTDGTIYVGGAGKLARLDKAGKVLQSVAAAQGGFPQGSFAALATTEQDLFACIQVNYSFAVYRLTHDLGEPKRIVDRLRGCCGQMHVVARDGAVYAAENARHRVVRFDRDGKLLGAWGKGDRTAVEGFGSCCNPMNLCFGPDGALYTSEATLGRVKRYTPEGKFLGLVGTADVGGGCVNVSVAASQDGSRVYVLDTTKSLIRVLARK